MPSSRCKRTGAQQHRSHASAPPLKLLGWRHVLKRARGRQPTSRAYAPWICAYFERWAAARRLCTALLRFDLPCTAEDPEAAMPCDRSCSTSAHFLLNALRCR